MAAANPVGELRRFLAVGALMAACNLGLLAVMVDGFGWPVLAACCVSFFLLNNLAYLVNKAFAFRLGLRPRGPEWLRYQGVMLVSLGLNLGLMAWMVGGIGMHYLVASLLVTVLLAGVNFAAHRGFTFARSRGARAPVCTDPPATTGTPLRLLQVSAFFAAHGGGIEAVADQLARRLAAAGLRVHWMAGGPAHEAPADLPDGLTIDHAPTWDPLEPRIGLPLPLWSLPALRRLWHAVGAHDVVHVHDYIYLPTLLALLAARLRGKPVLLTQHIGEIAFASPAATRLLRLLNRSVGAWALARAAQVVFVGRPVMQHFTPLVRFAQPPLLLPNGVDHARFTPSFDTVAAPPQQPVPLLFVGRFVEKKGLPILRHAATLPGAAWRFVGWGPLGPETWPADERGAVELIGRLPPTQIAEQYRQAALLVLPSTGEGFPLVLQEALACGTPVLVSTEVFEAFPQVDERCVFHVELRGLSAAAAGQALRSRLQALVDQPQQLAAARTHAAALAQQWSWPACADAYRALYRSLAAGAGRPGDTSRLQ